MMMMGMMGSLIPEEDFFNYRRVFGYKKRPTLRFYPTTTSGNMSDHFTFENAYPSAMRDSVVDGVVAAAARRFPKPGQVNNKKNHIAITWLGVEEAAAPPPPPRYHPITDDEWLAYDEACRDLYAEYERLYESNGGGGGAWPRPDWELFTNDRAFTDQFIRIRFLDPVAVAEYGPYVVRDVTAAAPTITPDGVSHAASRVSYYDPLDGVWCTARVEDRAVLKVQGLRRGQCITDSIMYDSFYEGHGLKCETCGSWWAEHGPRQCDVPMFWVPGEYWDDDDDDDKDEDDDRLLN